MNNKFTYGGTFSDGKSIFYSSFEARNHYFQISIGKKMNPCYNKFVKKTDIEYFFYNSNNKCDHFGNDSMYISLDHCKVKKFFKDNRIFYLIKKIPLQNQIMYSRKIYFEAKKKIKIKQNITSCLKIGTSQLEIPTDSMNNLFYYRKITYIATYSLSAFGLFAGLVILYCFWHIGVAHLTSAIMFVALVSFIQAVLTIVIGGISISYITKIEKNLNMLVIVDKYNCFINNNYNKIFHQLGKLFLRNILIIKFYTKATIVLSFAISSIFFLFLFVKFLFKVKSRLQKEDSDKDASQLSKSSQEENTIQKVETTRNHFIENKSNENISTNKFLRRKTFDIKQNFSKPIIRKVTYNN